MNLLNPNSLSLSAVILLTISSTVIAEDVEYSLPLTANNGIEYDVVFAYDTDNFDPSSTLQYGYVSLPNASIELRSPSDGRIIRSFNSVTLNYIADPYHGQLMVESVSPEGFASLSIMTDLDAANYISFSPLAPEEFSFPLQSGTLNYWTPQDWGYAQSHSQGTLAKSLPGPDNGEPIEPQGSIVTYSLTGNSYEGPVDLTIIYDIDDSDNYYNYAYQTDVFPNALVTVTSGFDTFEFEGVEIFSDQWTTRFTTQNYSEFPNEFTMEFNQGLPLDMNPTDGTTSELYLPWVRVDARDYSSTRALIQLNFDQATLSRTTSNEEPTYLTEMTYQFQIGPDVIEFGYSDHSLINDLYGNGQLLEIRGGRFFANVQGQQAQLTDFLLDSTTYGSESTFSITPLVNPGVPAEPIRFHFTVSVFADDSTAIPLTEFKETGGSAQWLNFTFDDMNDPNLYMYLNVPSADFQKIVN